MPSFFRLLAAGIILTSAIAGCSTPNKRARENPAAFRQLSATDQKLVLHGHIRPGMSEQAMYLAWGKPDQKTTSNGDGKDGSVIEKWIYRQRVTLIEPQNCYNDLVPTMAMAVCPPPPGYSLGMA